MPHLRTPGWWLRRCAGSPASPLTRPTGLACGCCERPAWSEPSPGAPGHDINHLDEDLSCGLRRAARAHQIDGRMEVGLTRRNPLREQQRESCLDQNVQAPT